MKINVKAYETELKSLFKEIFSESDFFTDLIFEKKLYKSHCFAVKNNGIVSFLFGIEKQYKKDRNLGKCIYIYGVGTKEEYRGKGYAKALMEEAYSYFSDIDFLYLVPANESLFKMYEKLGYKTEFFLNRYTATLTEKKSDLILKNGNYKADYADFCKKNDNIILLSDEDIEITLNYTKYKKVNNSGFLYEESENEVYIRECFIDKKEDLNEFLALLSQKYKKAHITEPFGNIPYAMIKPYGNFSFSGTSYTNMNFD